MQLGIHPRRVSSDRAVARTWRSKSDTGSEQYAIVLSFCSRFCSNPDLRRCMNFARCVSSECRSQLFAGYLPSSLVDFATFWSKLLILWLLNIKKI